MSFLESRFHKKVLSSKIKMGDCGCKEGEEKITHIRGRNLLKLIRGIPKKEIELPLHGPSDGPSDGVKLPIGGEIIIKTETLPFTVEEITTSNCYELEELSLEAQIERKRLDHLLFKIEQLRCRNIVVTKNEHP